jgi:diaminopimelate epimerase
MEWSFSKYVGCGNDFILIDDRNDIFPITHPSTIRHLCHRQYGIGADGLILLQNSTIADARMRIFNADGSEAAMCGNGIRCLMQFMDEVGLSDSMYQIETMQRLLKVVRKQTEINVEMGPPQHVCWNQSIVHEEKTYFFDFLDTGVPHTVFFVDHIEDIPLLEWGRFVRYHSFFRPEGTNVNIAQLLSNQTIAMRTYERGVEGETLACGTGATAVALAAAHRFGLTSPISIQTCSKEILTISFQQNSAIFSDVFMQGPATRTFRGAIQLLSEVYC